MEEINTKNNDCISNIDNLISKFPIEKLKNKLRLVGRTFYLFLSI